MNNFKKGDVLIGKKRSFNKAYHFLVFISGPSDAPTTVLLTHSNKFPCNIELVNSYDGKKSYFIDHLIEKMAEWGPYEKYNKINRLKEEDLSLIMKHVSEETSMPWKDYLSYTKNGCPKHSKIS